MGGTKEALPSVGKEGLHFSLLEKNEQIFTSGDRFKLKVFPSVFPEADATSHDAKAKRVDCVNHIHVCDNENTHQMSNRKSSLPATFISK